VAADDQLTASVGGSLVDGAERALRDWLVPGHFRTGDRLPPEHDLAGMLGVSRGTLRTALRRLERTGEIVRRQGSGTYVGRLGAPRDGRGPLRVESFATRAAIGTLSVAAVRIESGPIGASAAAALEVEPDQHSTRVRRVLSTDHEPAVLAHDIFHPELPLPEAPVLRSVLRSGREVLELLEASGTPAAVSRTRISPRILTPEEPLGRRLALSDPTGCLVIEEVVLGAGGRPLLYSWDVIAPGMVEIEVVRSATAALPDPGAVRGHLH
jgi:DNA-binding GntR family transcriptional regulator